MNFKALALASVIGLSAPAITAITFSANSVSAKSVSSIPPTGTFADVGQQWEVRLFLDEFGVYSYEAVNTKNGNSLTLKKPTITREEQAYIYTFKNGKYRYQIIYNGSDPNSIALYVFNPSGKVILNRVMVKHFQRPQGTYTDAKQEWVVRLYNDRRAYIYEGENVKTGDKINLKNPKSWREEHTYFYMFRNGKYRYFITYDPADQQKKINLFVLNPSGENILERDLTLEQDI
ncbi:MAG: hypothetical protein QNJ47_06365 [Nostocaceae cyanobacterium]|nr:hypothetical protein [Nostocaceae cyanobacterium]